MIFTIQKMLDSFEGDPPELFTKVLGGLAPENELIRKELPARLLRFDEEETAAVGVISSIRRDRDDEVLEADGIDVTNYSKIVLWQHDYWREAIPHATNLWVAKDPPKGIPYRIAAKTQYLTEMSELGNDVYRYRLAEHPLGQSVGFRAKETLRKGQTGYDEHYKDWVKRVKDMLRSEGLKAAPGEFDEPDRFYTKWELWEYSDVFIGSNVDALQIAVKSGIITNDEARLLVDFKGIAEPDGGMGEINELRERVAALEAELQALKDDKGSQPPLAPPLDLQTIWENAKIQDDNSGKTMSEMWNGK